MSVKPLPRRQADTAKLHENWDEESPDPQEVAEAMIEVIGATATSKTCERVAMYLRCSISFAELVSGDLS